MEERHSVTQLVFSEQVLTQWQNLEGLHPRHEDTYEVLHAIVFTTWARAQKQLLQVFLMPLFCMNPQSQQVGHAPKQGFLEAQSFPFAKMEEDSKGAKNGLPTLWPRTCGTTRL